MSPALEPVVMTILVIVGVNLALAYAFVVWGRWLSRTYDAPRWVRWSGVIPSVLWMALVATSIYSFATATHFSAETAAADRQRLLANAIATGMYSALFAMITQLVGLVTMLGLTWRYRWSKKLPKAEGTPPYR